MTPNSSKSGGEELDIACGFHPSPFGRCLIAITERGVCALRFTHVAGSPRDDAEALEWLRCAGLASRFPTTRPGEHGPDRRPVFASPGAPAQGPLHLHVRGTNFQIKVWEALLAIPFGRVTSYGDIARRLGAPRASRAVGGAVGSNPLPYLIPCHRVIRSSGETGEYGEGPARKKAILAWEAARAGGTPEEGVPAS